MMKCVLSLLIFLFFSVAPIQATEFPSGNVPDGLGVNIHMHNFTIEDGNMIKETGFGFIRTDLLWNEVEKVKGVYDFRTFDRLVAESNKRNIRILFILDYGNPLYGSHNSIITQESKVGFINFVKQAVKRYKNNDIIWEIWNEPDCTGFWDPQPSVDKYMELVKDVVPAIRSIEPDAKIIAPANGDLEPPFPFLEECFKRGLLNLVDGISVHPYRQKHPETVIEDYDKLRALIARYNPAKANIPIISSEWGYSSTDPGMDQEVQAKAITRMFLLNLSANIPISIWYDWRNDGPSATNRDHNWGLVGYFHRKPKLARIKLVEMIELLRGKRFTARLLHSDPNVFILRFSSDNNSKHVIVGWVKIGEIPVKLSNGKTYNLTEYPKYLKTDQILEIVNE